MLYFIIKPRRNLYIANAQKEKNKGLEFEAYQLKFNEKCFLF